MLLLSLTSARYKMKMHKKTLTWKKKCHHPGARPYKPIWLQFQFQNFCQIQTEHISLGKLANHSFSSKLSEFLNVKLQCPSTIFDASYQLIQEFQRINFITLYHARLLFWISPIIAYMNPSLQTPRMISRGLSPSQMVPFSVHTDIVYAKFTHRKNNFIV